MLEKESWYPQYCFIHCSVTYAAIRIIQILEEIYFVMLPTKWTDFCAAQNPQIINNKYYVLIDNASTN